MNCRPKDFQSPTLPTELSGQWVILNLDFTFCQGVWMKFYINALLFDVDGTVLHWNQTSSVFSKILQNPKAFVNIIQDMQKMERKRGQRFPNDKSHTNRETQELQIIDTNQINLETKRLILHSSKKNIPMGIVSDNRSIEKLKQLQLQDFFSVVVNCRDTGNLKPSPEGLLRASSQLGYLPSQVLYIGDRNRVDDRACFEIGMHFLHIENIDRLEYETIP